MKGFLKLIKQGVANANAASNYHISGAKEIFSNYASAGIGYVKRTGLGTALGTDAKLVRNWKMKYNVPEGNDSTHSKVARKLVEQGNYKAAREYMKSKGNK